MSFYWKLLIYPLREGRHRDWRSWRGALLMLTSQVAYVFGAFLEAAWSRRKLAPVDSGLVPEPGQKDRSEK